jgi:hypothetical protein
MTAIQNFLIGVWNDLRGRRLLPVAALLVAGLVAAPIVLSKKADENAAPPPGPATQTKAPQSQGPEGLAQVTLDDEPANGSGSSLSAFDTSNPFAPPEEIVEAARLEAQGDAVPTSPDTGAITGPGTGTGGGPTPGGETPQPDTGGGEKTSEFSYVLDVTFWANGRRREIEGMQKLEMLPSQAAPLLIFMGVSDGAGNAVFLVDSTLTTTGEGKCKPSPSECAFLYLGAGSEQEFTNDEGDSYRLLIDEIRKVEVGSESAGATASSKSSKSARAAVGAPAPARRFVLPVLTDLIVQTVKDSNSSTHASKRR